MYLPPLLQLRQPPDHDPRHRLCPAVVAAVAASVVYVVVPGVSTVPCAAVVLEVETVVAAVVLEVVAD